MNRWRLLNIGSTEVILHPVTLAFLLYTYFTGHLVITLISFLSILFHEAAHSVTASLCGQVPSHIEITPLGAIMRTEDTAHLSFVKRLLIIAAGPAFTFGLCTLSLWGAKTGLIDRNIGDILFRCNLAILLVNLLPFLPLDGGRLLHLLLTTFLPRTIVTNIIQAASYLGGSFLIVANLFVSWTYGGWNLSLAFAGCCILYNASTFTVTQAMTELRFFVDRKIQLERKGMMRTESYIAVHNTPLRRLIRMLPANRAACFFCAEIGSQRILGSIHEAELIRHYLSNPTATFGEVLASADNQ